MAASGNPHHVKLMREVISSYTLHIIPYLQEWGGVSWRKNVRKPWRKHKQMCTRLVQRKPA